MDNSVSDDSWGFTALSVLFIVATLIADILFEQFLICDGVNIAG